MAMQRKANEQSKMAMQRLGGEQVKLREEHEASLARHKAELDASFTEKVQVTVVMEMNFATQAAGFSDLAVALEALWYVGNVNGSVNAFPSPGNLNGGWNTFSSLNCACFVC